MKNMKPIRVYADTSVFGGVFDDEFKHASVKFFDAVRHGRFELVVSPRVRDEIMDAPEDVRDLFNEMLADYAVLISITPEAIDLQEQYLKRKILTPKWEDDALHVALATVNNCQIIVSWNFHHIVNFQKIPLYNAVNQLAGYHPIAIYSPLEVIFYEKRL